MATSTSSFRGPLFCCTLLCLTVVKHGHACTTVEAFEIEKGLKFEWPENFVERVVASR
jgi:hypothetical protein